MKLIQDEALDGSEAFLLTCVSIGSRPMNERVRLDIFEFHGRLYHGNLVRKTFIHSPHALWQQGCGDYLDQ